MWPNPQFSPNLVTFTEKILNGKLQFLCCDIALLLLKRHFVNKSIQFGLMFLNKSIQFSLMFFPTKLELVTYL